MVIRDLINKKAWYDYSIHNPFRTAKQRKKDLENAKYYRCSGEKTWSDYHPKEDELLTNLKAMLEPEQPLFLEVIEKAASALLYRYEKFIRKHTDVCAAIFRKRSKKDEEANKRCDESVSEDIRARNQERIKEWEMKDKARKIGERCMIQTVNRPYRQH